MICCYALTKIIFLIILKEIYGEKFTFILLKNNKNIKDIFEYSNNFTNSLNCHLLSKFINSLHFEFTVSMYLKLAKVKHDS